MVSWGESTFIQQGINVVNPIDISKLRVAGSELKEAFLPIDMVFASFAFNENLSMEMLYMLEFENTEPEPAGTYFSTNDVASLGGEYLMLNFGLVGEPSNYDLCPTILSGVNPYGTSAAGQLQFTIDRTACSAAVPRNPDRFADDNGQYGVKFTYFSPDLNNTEFGLYFLNYHSRLPLLSGVAVTNSNAFSARYFAEYPEDIELYGFSFNTTLEGSIVNGDNLTLAISQLIGNINDIYDIFDQPSYDESYDVVAAAPGTGEILGPIKLRVPILQYQ